jgi:lysozyme
LKTSNSGREFIKYFEALILLSYKDITGIWTVGYGHTRNVKEGQKISEIQAEELLSLDLIPGEEAINATNNFLIQTKFDALSSFIFNIGVGRFKKSTLFKHLFSRDYSKVADEFPKWNKARIDGELKEVKGLTRRRNAERELFLRGVYD